MVTPAPAVEKACEWNRYCRYIGPLHTGSLVQVGVGRPAVVGKCYDCGRYVCNRCAARTGDQALVAGLWRAGVWALACPFDGTPLGRGGEWALTGPGADAVLRRPEQPGFEEWCQVLVGPLAAPSREAAGVLIDAWAAGRDEEVMGAARADLPEELAPLVQTMTRRALERLKRFDEAWALQQHLLQAAPAGFLKAIGHAIRLLPPGTPRDGLVAELRQLARTEGAGLDAMLSLLSSGLSDALDATKAAAASGPAPPPADSAPTADREAATSSPVRPRRTGVRDPRPPERSPIPGLGPDGLARLFTEFPGPWDHDTWPRFVVQCERDHGLVFPGGAEVFAAGVTSPGTPLLALLVVALRDDAGTLPGSPLATIERYALHCARGARDWPARGPDEDALLLPLDQLAGQRLDPDGSGRAAGLRAIAGCCPLVAEGDNVLRFAHPAYADAFLARVLGRRLFRTDPPDFRSLGSLPLSAGAAEFLADLAARDPGHGARLDEWLRFRRQRRSQYRGADIPGFVRNLALVRYALDGDLSGLDLRELDFRDLDLTGADLRDTVLDGAVLRNARLRGARLAGASLNGTDLQGADLDGSDLERR